MHLLRPKCCSIQRLRLHPLEAPQWNLDVHASLRCTHAHTQRTPRVVCEFTFSVNSANSSWRSTHHHWKYRRSLELHRNPVFTRRPRQRNACLPMLGSARNSVIEVVSMRTGCTAWAPPCSTSGETGHTAAVDGCPSKILNNAKPYLLCYC